MLSGKMPSSKPARLLAPFIEGSCRAGAGYALVAVPCEGGPSGARAHAYGHGSAGAGGGWVEWPEGPIPGKGGRICCPQEFLNLANQNFDICNFRDLGLNENFRSVCRIKILASL